ncbi:MAG: hypothetical protein A3E09_00460 [Candidatus Liptonbacteria bacterium RIFCSPHIGHO2_12_FULL_60_13]|uniref:Uncharacterized protein n=1 Tax=Candidatus Liptonbacteria bacterium RIFCSPHIGHO2_12_FULL_60_13 TaxID=1798648 RepID=A0A1G2CBC1_9BACT|nr:MAG: hypothetical protein A3E09_00460 [Candidatus Liptonbacteria bacterium RIFCSPHIGHO2_12_FULL_60_13]
MSVGTAVLVIVMIVIAAIVGRATANARKRFGLNEAKAAARYVGDNPSSAQAIMGVVLGVLGYENTVAEDVRALAEEKSRENAASAKSIESNEAEIGRLNDENRDLHVAIAANEAEVADAGQMAALFRG